MSWSRVLPHHGVHSAICKVDVWPALLDFKTLKRFRLWPHSRLAGETPAWVLKRHVCTHTCTYRHSGTHSVFLKGPLHASLSFPPTHSSVLTLTTAVTTCILFSWIFQALQSSRCCYIYIVPKHFCWGWIVSKTLLHYLVHLVIRISLTQISAVLQKEVSPCAGHSCPRALLLKVALLFWRASVAKGSPGRFISFYLWLVHKLGVNPNLVSSCPFSSGWAESGGFYEGPLQKLTTLTESQDQLNALAMIIYCFSHVTGCIWSCSVTL